MVSLLELTALLLSNFCLVCHGSDKAIREAKRILDLPEVVDSVRRVLPAARPADHKLILRITSEFEDGLRTPLDEVDSLAEGGVGDPQALASRWRGLSSALGLREEISAKAALRGDGAHRGGMGRTEVDTHVHHADGPQDL